MQVSEVNDLVNDLLSDRAAFNVWLKAMPIDFARLESPDYVDRDVVAKMLAQALESSVGMEVLVRSLISDLDCILLGENNTRTAAETQEYLKGQIGQVLGVDHLLNQEGN